MSQASNGLVIPGSPLPGANLVTEIQEVISALASMHKGSSRPVYAAAGMTWIKEVSATEWQINFYNGSIDILLATFNPVTDTSLYAGEALALAGADNTKFMTALRTKQLVDSLPTNASVGPNVLSPHESLIIRQVTTETIDIDAAAILLKDDSGNTLRVENVDLTIDITVSGENGLDTGSESVSTWYYLWVISDGSTVSSLLSLSSTIGSLTLPSGYTYAGLVGAALNESTGDLDDFHQEGRRVAAGVFAVLAGGSSNSVTAVSLALKIPPIAKVMTGSASVGSTSSSAGLASGNIWSDAAAVYGRLDFVSRNQTISKEGGAIRALIIVPQTIYYSVGSNDSMTIQCSGWEY